MSFFADVWKFLRGHKRYWLLPLLLMLGFFGLLVLWVAVLTDTPFVYTLF